MSQPPLNRQRKEERQPGDDRPHHEQRFQNISPDIRDVRDATVLGDVFRSALGEPRYEHGEQCACIQHKRFGKKIRDGLVSVYKINAPVTRERGSTDRTI